MKKLIVYLIFLLLFSCDEKNNFCDAYFKNINPKIKQEKLPLTRKAYTKIYQLFFDQKFIYYSSKENKYDTVNFEDVYVTASMDEEEGNDTTSFIFHFHYKEEYLDGYNNYLFSSRSPSIGLVYLNKPVDSLIYVFYPSGFMFIRPFPNKSLNYFLYENRNEIDSNIIEKWKEKNFKDSMIYEMQMKKYKTYARGNPNLKCFEQF